MACPSKDTPPNIRNIRKQANIVNIAIIASLNGEATFGTKGTESVNHTIFLPINYQALIAEIFRIPLLLHHASIAEKLRIPLKSLTMFANCS